MFGHIKSNNRKDSPMKTWLMLLAAILPLLIAAVTGVTCVVDFAGGLPISTMRVRVLVAIGTLAWGVMYLSRWIAMRRSARRRDRP
jgi:hypothetical protein